MLIDIWLHLQNVRTTNMFPQNILIVILILLRMILQIFNLFWRIRYFHYIHENCRMIKCIYNDKRYSIIIVNARFGMHMQLDVVINFKNLRIRPSFRQNNTLKSRLASDQILWIEQSDRVIIRLLTYDTLFYSTLLAKKYLPNISSYSSFWF